MIPQAGKAKLLVHAQVCERPGQPFAMAALLAAAWNAAGRADAAEVHVTAYSGYAACHAFAYTLPSLLAQPRWLPAVEAVVQRLAPLMSVPAGQTCVQPPREV